MSSMFFNAVAFNQPIGDWDVSNVETMSGMFGRDYGGTMTFNNGGSPDIDGWDTSGVTNMSRMFDQSRAFNQPIGSWDTSKVTNMSTMFRNATAFNRDIGAWDVSNVTNMSELFRRTGGASSVFNNGGSGSLNGWDVSSVQNMERMFSGATAFNQPIDTWAFTGNVNLNSFMEGKTGGNSYNTTDYNALLIRWDDLVAAGTLDDSRTVDMGGAKHSGLGSEARDRLIDAGWTITDGGEA